MYYQILFLMSIFILQSLPSVVILGFVLTLVAIRQPALPLVGTWGPVLPVATQGPILLPSGYSGSHSSSQWLLRVPFFLKWTTSQSCPSELIR